MCAWVDHERGVGADKSYYDNLKCALTWVNADECTLRRPPCLRPLARRTPGHHGHAPTNPTAICLPLLSPIPPSRRLVFSSQVGVEAPVIPTRRSARSLGPKGRRIMRVKTAAVILASGECSIAGAGHVPGPHKKCPSCKAQLTPELVKAAGEFTARRGGDPRKTFTDARTKAIAKPKAKSTRKRTSKRTTSAKPKANGKTTTPAPELHKLTKAQLVELVGSLS